MAKKSKATEPEPLSGDILDLLWTHVINPDPSGAWLDETLKESAAMPEPLKTALPAIHRLLAAKVSREDLGRVARQERYERCFGLLYELDDPGLKSGKLTGLREQLLNPPARGGKEKEFMTGLWEAIGKADDDGDRWAGSSVKEVKDEPFGDVDAAVTRLLWAGVQPRDLELFARWQRFDATVAALHLFERADISEAEELLGLHESILSAEPSGKEAKPESWPVPTSAPAKVRANDEPTKPFLELKGVEGFAYTPDGKGLVLGWRHIIDSETGEKRLAYEVKDWPTSGAFTKDYQRVILTAEPNKVIVCDAQTGKLRQQTKWPKKIRGLQVIAVPNADQFLIETFTPNNSGGFDERYIQFDTAGLTFGEEISILPENTTSRILEWSADGRILFAYYHTRGLGVSGTHLRAWSWPELKPVWTVGLPERETPWSMTSSSDGRILVTSSLDGEVAVLNAATGKRMENLKVDDNSNHVAFSADNRYLAVGGHSGGKIRVWDFTTRRVVCELDTGTGWCAGVCFSPGGKTLGAVGHRKALFWRFAPLLEGHT